MSLPDLDTLLGHTHDELVAFQAKVAKAIHVAQERARDEAKAAALEAIKATGFSFTELFGGETAATGKPARAKTASVAKYANPADPTQTWSGRGRKPHWVVEWLAAGKALDDLLIR
ncbi:H-NS histone family protein [Paenirhodobacter enshiensis]|uniref:DNA-binding protein H-NS-like C-terminal domain-containing protein n=1 Tax=Paenirhodobacter enshiensis TaxID=1105367 RepID=A0A086Y1H7_9RHOB|nr:H-NS histone family protein [Paenirhodobacter enshiensis]KFI28127.1 hypothetical protein CG50_14620 [Paenirhodobacter enshiensis]